MDSYRGLFLQHPKLSASPARTWCSTTRMAAADAEAARAAPDGGPRHAAPPADLRPREGRRAGQRRRARATSPQRLDRAGIRDVVLNLHHRPASIAASSATAAISASASVFVGVSRCSDPPAARDTRCPLFAGRSDDDDFLIVNGDTLTDVDLWPLLARHRESGALVTMALIPNPRPDSTAASCVSPDGRSRGSREPADRRMTGERTAQSTASTSSASRSRRRACSRRSRTGCRPSRSSGSIPASWPNSPGVWRRFVSQASFQDIGTPGDYLETSLALARVEGASIDGARTRASRIRPVPSAPCYGMM